MAKKIDQGEWQVDGSELWLNGFWVQTRRFRYYSNDVVVPCVVVSMSGLQVNDGEEIQLPLIFLTAETLSRLRVWLDVISERMEHHLDELSVGYNDGSNEE